MSQLHELLAVEGDLNTTATKLIAEAITTFTKKPDTYRGAIRKLEMLEDARSGENLVDSKELVDTVPAKLQYVSGPVGKYWDAMARKEEANQRATADLIVDGEVLAKDLPATLLLGLETRLKSIRDLIETAPTLDPSLSWTEDNAAGEHRYRSQDKTTMKTEKMVKHKILVEATKEHPAQIEKWNEDVPVGRIELTQYSGMISPARKAVLMGKVDALIRGTKKARQRANTVEVSNLSISGPIFAYLFD